MLYAFLWVIPRRLNFICRRFRTHCLFHLHRQVGMKCEVLHTYLPVKMEQTVCSETLAYKIQMPGNYPEKSIQRVYFSYIRNVVLKCPTCTCEVKIGMHCRS